MALILLIGCQATPQNVVQEEGVLLTPPTPTIEVVSAPVSDTQASLIVTPAAGEDRLGEVALYQDAHAAGGRAHQAICWRA